MLSDIELETSRIIFEIEKELMLSQLREMLEKTMQIENSLRKSINELPEQEDTYNPCKDIVSPPKKKMKL
jgi:hypothetical protein